MPTEQLSSAVYQHVLHHVLPDLDNELRIVSLLPEGVRAVYATTLLDNEVLNGGFNQFFWNARFRGLKTVPEHLSRAQFVPFH